MTNKRYVCKLSKDQLNSLMFKAGYMNTLDLIQGSELSRGSIFKVRRCEPVTESVASKLCSSLGVGIDEVFNEVGYERATKTERAKQHLLALSDYCKSMKECSECELKDRCQKAIMMGSLKYL